MDPQLEEKIVHEVKSQGVFDEFRKDSMADVDTKPAYQNLRQRVENTVRNFLSEQKWTPETNKNQLRERLRRHITESGFLDVGVERIVDQVVNPKICTIFQPRIEDIAYKYLGIPLPPVKPPPPSLIHPLPPLPLNGSLNVETGNVDLLPTDLEQVSPDSDKATIKSEIKEETSGFEDERLDDEDESPPFEPVGKCKSPDIATKSSIVKLETETETGLPSTSIVSRSSKVMHNHDIDETQDTIKSVRTGEFDSEKDASRSLDAIAIQESQLSQVSSDTQLSHVTPKGNDLDDEIKQRSGLEPAACNISEEAQMPKFNENSCDIKREASSQLHFDINKDEIKFEGTERKNNVTPVEQENVIKGEKKNNELVICRENRSTEEFCFNDDVDRSQLPSERSICSSQDDSSSMHLVIVEKPKEELEKETTIMGDENSSMAVTQTLISQTDKSEVAKQSSSASHKKHSRDKYRSHDRDRPKDKEKDKDRQKDVHIYKERKGERIRHKSRERERDKHSRSSKYSSSSSKHSSSATIYRHDNVSGSKQEKPATKSFHSSSSSSSSRGEKRNDTDKSEKSKNKSKIEKSDRKSVRDDHFESKEKPLRRRSTDSNDEDKSSTAPASNNSAAPNTIAKSKSSSETSGTTSSSSISNAVKGSANCNVDTSALTPSISCDMSEATSQQSRSSRVIILNEILENPATNFIALEPNYMEVVMKSPAIATGTTNTTPIPVIPTISGEDEGSELYFFENLQDDDFSTRIDLLNYAMNSCRQVMNSLRLELLHEDSNKAAEDRTITRSTKRTAMMATLHVVDCQLDYRTAIEGSANEGALPLKYGKLSPTASEASSGCSKENEAIDKNAMDTGNGYSLLAKQSMGRKLNQQRRYSKPRPIILSQRSKRRAVVVDSLI